MILPDWKGRHSPFYDNVHFHNPKDNGMGDNTSMGADTITTKDCVSSPMDPWVVKPFLEPRIGMLVAPSNGKIGKS